MVYLMSIYIKAESEFFSQKWKQFYSTEEFVNIPSTTGVKYV